MRLNRHKYNSLEFQELANNIELNKSKGEQYLFLFSLGRRKD